jgi:uncharacterized membrane protein YagU involved in acid resistance
MTVRQQIHTPAAPHDIRWGLRNGAIAGIVAGLVFAAFEMVVSAFMMGAGAFFMPLRMIGAIALGSEALSASYSILAAGIAGVIVHIILAIVYGLIFGAIATVLRGPMAYVGLATVFGFALWLINFYLIAPFAFPWFQEASPIVQFIAHTFFFGTVLGFFLWKSHERSELEIPKV